MYVFDRRPYAPPSPPHADNNRARHRLDGVPRAGLTLEQKAVFEQALLDAKTKSHFKAAVKQLCGGKKKNTGGTPANGNAS